MQQSQSDPLSPGKPLQPDYTNCIVNLVRSLVPATGEGQQEYGPLAALEGVALSGRTVVLLVIDGLGDLFLQNHPDTFLGRHRRARLTSVFPTTTATAVTSFFTGVAPQQHAITGWHTYFRELGAVATVLPFIPRFGGACLAEAEITPVRLITGDSLLNGLARPCHVVLPDYLIESAYSRALSGRAGRHGCGSLAEMFSRIDMLVRGEHDALIMAYWPELDSLAHARGMGSDEATAHFLEIDRLCSINLAGLIERGATVIVSSDHGLIDTDEAHTIYLEEHPELAASLTLPLCGEPRCAYCYVRSDRREVFEGYIREKLAHACTMRRSTDLIREGYFGRGAQSPRLAERVGEYVLLMKENYIIRDRLLTEKRYRHRGVHGGLSEEELYVPLIVPGESSG